MLGYGGNPYLIKFFFTNALEFLFGHYVSIVGFEAVIAIVAGVVATAVILIVPPTTRIRRRILFVIAVLPILIGIVGMLLASQRMQTAILMEQKAGITPPSAYKYFDIQSGYTKRLLFLFPLVVGIASAIPPILAWCFFQNKKKV